jgi:hypothetical protein
MQLTALQLMAEHERRVQEVDLPEGAEQVQCVPTQADSVQVDATLVPTFSELAEFCRYQSQKNVHACSTEADPADVLPVQQGVCCVGASTSCRPSASERVHRTEVAASTQHPAPHAPAVRTPSKQEAASVKSVMGNVQHGQGVSCLFAGLPSSEPSAPNSAQASACAARRRDASAAAAAYLGGLCCGFAPKWQGDTLRRCSGALVATWSGLFASGQLGVMVQQSVQALGQGGMPWIGLLVHGVNHNPAAWQAADANLAGLGMSMSGWPCGGENDALVLLLPGKNVCLMAFSGIGDSFNRFW